MRIVAGLLGAALVVAVVAEGFNTIVLARRVQSVFRITRAFYRSTWLAYTALARRIREGRKRENFLSIYGPLSLLALIGIWAVGLVVGFGLMQWGGGLSTNGHPASLPHAIYYSGTSLFTAATTEADNSLSRFLMASEAGFGLSFLGLVVAYLPVLYQSYSTRELRISMMDARAGSPPSAAELLRRSGRTPAKLERELANWEQWSAEMLQHQLSYPMLGYFRSQHMNQSWLGSLTAILDASAIVALGSGDDLQNQAEATFAMARHAIVDLARVFGSPPKRDGPDRLPPETYVKVRDTLEHSETAVEMRRVSEKELRHLRGLYEPYAYVLSRHFLSALPGWMETESEAENWRRTDWERPTREFAVSDPFRKED